jgi:RNA polymerase-binding transcription factor DksA
LHLNGCTERGGIRGEFNPFEEIRMDEIRRRLERELDQTIGRIRQNGGGVALEDMAGALGESTTLADEGDLVRLNEDREMTFATRSLLVERANRLAEALERLRDGEYGICMECGEPIAPARLRAMPEVTTCVRCQDRLERSRYRLQPVGAAFDSDEDSEE